MRNKRLERSLYGPTFLEITLGLFLSILLGAALGVLFLIFKPVTQVAELPKVDERKQGMVYYVPGAIDYSKAKQWMGKRQKLVESSSGDIIFTEDDLNAWSASGQPQPPAPPPNQKDAPPPPPPEDLVTPSTVNFKLRDGSMQVGLPTTINLMGFVFPVISQAQGKFEKRGDMFMYIPEEVMIGSLPLHRFPGAVDYLVKEVYSKDRIPEEFLTAWLRASNVAIDGNTLRITIQ